MKRPTKRCRNSRLIDLIARTANFHRLPNRRGDVALGFGFVVEVIDGDDLSVTPLHAARIAEVAPAAIRAKRDFAAPGFSSVRAEAREFQTASLTVGETEPAILQPNQARRIAFSLRKKILAGFEL